MVLLGSLLFSFVLRDNIIVIILLLDYIVYPWAPNYEDLGGRLAELQWTLNPRLKVYVSDKMKS